MSTSLLAFEQVCFAFAASSDSILEDLTLQLCRGWHGIIGPNGAGKTTLLRLACGQIPPTRGSIARPPRVIYCAQRTDDPPEHLLELLASTDPSACEIRGRLEIDSAWVERWSTLSHGERKRCQIATALWLEPQLLAIDEPTNHIDTAARGLLIKALRSFRGIGLLVSHDRELLDELCEQTLFIDPPTVTLRPGGYTKAMELAQTEQERARFVKQLAKQRFEKLRTEVISRREEAAGADRKRSKRDLARRDSDGREKIDVARVTGKDGKAGRLLKQLEGRFEQAENRLDGLFVKKDRKLGIELAGETSPRPVILRLDAGALLLSESRTLVHDKLTIARDDRIAVIGRNGSGKSTLIRYIMSKLELPNDRIVYVPQEIDRHEGAQILAQVRSLPRAQLGKVLSAIACLGSSADRLLQSEQPSPGEMRKILLAMGLSRVPHLIVMDEPTNHLDLPSIRAMEQSLAQTRCALVLVSHDMPFLRAVTTTTWRIEVENRFVSHLRV